MGYPEGLWRDQHAGCQCRAWQIAGRNARRQAGGADARSWRRYGRADRQDGRVPSVLHRRQRQASGAGDRAWRGTKLPDAGRRRESRPNQFRRDGPHLEPVADEGFADARQIVSRTNEGVTECFAANLTRDVHREVREHRPLLPGYPHATARERPMKLATIALAGALALSSSIAMAQGAGAGGAAGSAGGTSGGVSGSPSPSGGMAPATGATTGQSRPGAMGNPGAATANPSGSTLVNPSPSGSTIDSTGTGSGTRR